MTTRRNGLTRTATSTGADRHAIHAYVTDDAHRTINRFSEENGVTVTGLIESMCMALAERMEHDGPGCDPDWVRAARKIDAIRRRRG